MATVTSTFPDVKLLINNAGVMRDLDFTQAQLLSQDLTQEIRANLDGVIHMTAGYVGKKNSPEQVVEMTLAAAWRGQEEVYPGEPR